MQDLERFRITYAKQKSLRFIGHLDMLRTWERTLRRAKLPVAFTEGFHPHAKINLGQALPLGFTSESELVEIWLDEKLALEKVEEKVLAAIPPGIVIQAIETVDLSTPKLQKRIISAEYEVAFNPAPLIDELGNRVDDLLTQESISRTRRGKTYDLRPLIEKLTLKETSEGVLLEMRLAVGEGKTGRPDEVVFALGEDPLKTQIHRSALNFNKENV